MIFNRWGTRVTINGYCGKVQPKWANVPLMLVRVTYHDDDQTERGGFQFATNLRADGGFGDIEKAIDAVPEVELTKAEMKAAIAEAD